MFYRKGVLTNFLKFTSLRPATLIKKRLEEIRYTNKRCFSIVMRKSDDRISAPPFLYSQIDIDIISQKIKIE